MTFNCNLALDSAGLSYTVSFNHSLMKTASGVKEIYRGPSIGTLTLELAWLSYGFCTLSH